MYRKLVIGILALCVSLLAACAAPGNKASKEGKPKDSSGSTSAKDASESGTEEGAGTEAEGAYHKITAEEAKEMMDAGGVTVVDVRTEEEYAEKHIPDAVLVPNETIGEEQPELLPDLDAVLLVHCRTGVRSRQASDKLVELGYKNVYDFGGIVSWPYDTETGEWSDGGNE